MKTELAVWLTNSRIQAEELSKTKRVAKLQFLLKKFGFSPEEQRIYKSLK